MSKSHALYNEQEPHFRALPRTPLGWWAVGITATHLVLIIINTFVFMPGAIAIPARQTLLPYYGIIMMLTGFAGGVVGLLAILRQRERSWLVWLTILPALMTVTFLLGEFLVPH